MSRAAAIVVLLAALAAGTAGASLLPPGPLHSLASVVLFWALGLVLLAASFAVLDALTKHDLEKQVFEEKNVAVAIVVGAAVLATGAIICAAVAG
ncbi:MAG: DUF350 domain-containing protein [Planctomycetales bacterium]|nr:DUF350 domain-containing protein [Planctomycetales bacterium]